MNVPPRNMAYWLKVFLLYVLFEACIQLLFLFTLNTFGSTISDWQFHLIMWAFQCFFILPIWLVAYSLKTTPAWMQVSGNAAFFLLYTFFWYNVVQGWVAWGHSQLLPFTASNTGAPLNPPVDTWNYFHYQLLKHAFRLGWFYVGNFFFHYQQEEQQKQQLLLTNKQLQLNLMKWTLHPGFYFKTLDIISEKAKTTPGLCPSLILRLSQVMEFVLYKPKEKQIPVAEELSFLNDYIFLLNQDTSHPYNYCLQVTGSHEQLTIIPLVLVSIIENQLEHQSPSIKKMVISVSFEGETLQLKILPSTNNIIRISDPLLQRLQAFYPLKYQFANNTRDGAYWFKMQLNAI